MNKYLSQKNYTLKCTYSVPTSDDPWQSLSLGTHRIIYKWTEFGKENTYLFAPQ